VTLLQQGLTISLLGIGITFLALAALILLINLLHFIFRSQQREESVQHSTAVDSERQDEYAIAIAAAWWYLQRKKGAGLGKRLENIPGKWWSKSN
jgi:Na+-transporting methylmalonyl-CoA/oxaloacetate decarboxylase gamma subunit